MARRLPSRPPVLSGFTYVHVLGSGGFADVFLYEQNMPRRKVAIKVMLSEVVNDQVRQMFQAEANLMAQLSSHPSILTVYQASISADGRPYIVMEFCSSVLSERYRSERIPVPEILRIAVKIGSAMETAHRAGLLHRDLKPSNILLTAYGHPVLSDFGIASTLGESDNNEAVGMSIPWSAPEVLLDETPGTIQSEVWSFAATVYSLLAGRSPFEVPGEANKSADLMRRIERAKVQPIGRPDVPASLERVLQRAMSRKAEARPSSVLEVVRELQAVESELGVPQTPIEVEMDDWAMASVSDLEDQTRIRAVPTAVAGSAPRRRRRGSQVPAENGPVGTMVRASASSIRSQGLPLASGRSRRRWPVLAIAAAVVVVLGVSIPLVLASLRTTGGDIPTVTDIAAKSTATGIEFRWSDPGLLASDLYQISVDGSEQSTQSQNRFVVAAGDDRRACITVTVNRDGATGNPSGEKCQDVDP